MMRKAALLVVALFCLAGCFGGATDTPSPSARPTFTDPPAPKPAPKAGGCYDLAFAQASRPRSGGRSVPCDREHTAITTYVGTGQRVLDGHLLAVDSKQVQGQLASECPRRLISYLGTDLHRLRLSQFETVWFVPGVKQSDRGAHWYRCAIVAVAGPHRLAALPGDLRGALSSDDDLDEWGTCGTASPSARDFEKVICSQPHKWRAIEVVDLSHTLHYLGKPSTDHGNDVCKSAASAQADDSLSFSWSFQWPTRDQWDAGVRYGLCWVPDSD